MASTCRRLPGRESVRLVSQHFSQHGLGISPDLTRFNKIAIQGTPQMAVDKEALICLSRVYSYYF